MKFLKANSSDLKEILDLQKACYQEEAELYNDFTIPPLTQTIESIEEDFQKETFFKIEDRDRIIGSIRISVEGETGKIGRLIVDKNYRNQGLGKQLMNEVESRFSTLKRFELFTGSKSEPNLYLYKKLDYKEFDRKKINDNLELVFLEKDNE